MQVTSTNGRGENCLIYIIFCNLDRLLLRLLIPLESTLSYCLALLCQLCYHSYVLGDGRSRKRPARRQVEAEEPWEDPAGAWRDLPDIVQCQQGRVRLITLARVDGIPEIGQIRMVRIRSKNRHQARDIGLTIISDPQEA